MGELLVAIGLFAVAILSILGLSIAMARGTQKGDDTAHGGVVARILLERLVDRLRADMPAGASDDFWDQDHIVSPFEEGEIKNNNTDYQYKIYARTVRDTSGTEIGGTTPGNRLKKVDVSVWWWDSETEDRQGYGRLEIKNTRLISEGEM